MGLLNITKNLTFEQLRNVVCDKKTPFSKFIFIFLKLELKPTMLKCLFLGFINDF